MSVLRFIRDLIWFLIALVGTALTISWIAGIIQSLFT